MDKKTLTLEGFKKIEKQIKQKRNECNNYIKNKEKEINKHEEDYMDGYIYIDCDNDDSIEIDSIESFEKNARVLYQVIAKPDTSLDEV